MTKKTEKFTFRQRWMPGFNDAEQLREERYDRKGKDYDSKSFPVVDVYGRWTRSLILAGALVGTGYQGIGNSIQTKDSVYNGTITSFGREGIIFDTWEGSFAIGGEQRSVVGKFSLDEQMNSAQKDGLIAKLKEAADSGNSVRVHGKGYLATWPWRAGTTYLVDSVEPLKK